MFRNDVLKIMTDMGFTKTGVTEKNYDQYKSGTKLAWLHDYFIELESQGLAFPYREYEEPDLINYLENKNEWLDSENRHAPDRVVEKKE